MLSIFIAFWAGLIVLACVIFFCCAPFWSTWLYSIQLIADYSYIDGKITMMRVYRGLYKRTFYKDGDSWYSYRTGGYVGHGLGKNLNRALSHYNTMERVHIIQESWEEKLQGVNSNAEV